MRRVLRGVMAALRARPRAFALTALAVVLLDIGLPPLVLSVARTPWTFFTFNPWLKQLPAYVMGPAPLGEKLDFLTRVALFWFSADGPYGMPEWGFAVDTTDLARFLATGVLVGLFVALVLHQRGRGWRPAMSHGGGVIGACASVLGLTTGPCSVVGCGAPVLPVVGLVFAGLSSGTLALLSYGSRVATIVVFAGLGASIVYLGWQLGRPRASGRGARRTASRDFTAGVH